MQLIHQDPEVVLVTIYNVRKGQRWRVHHDCTMENSESHEGVFDDDGPVHFPLSKRAGITIQGFVDKKNNTEVHGLRFRGVDLSYNGHPAHVTLRLGEMADYS